jgi:fructose-1,6-bisphosphatase I
MKEIFRAIKKSAIKIDQIIKKGNTDKSKNENSSGDVQLELDILSDIVIEKKLSKLDSVHTICSEEKEKAVKINKNGKYFIAYDPLDGSSLVDVNLSVGSIFGIYEKSFDGKNLVASVYVVYGPRVELVIATNKVKLYRLNYETEHFDFVENIKLNDKGNLNATGGTQQQWLDCHKKLVLSIFEDGYRLRYSGGMVPDLHQILLKGGGLFSYPPLKDNPKSKLRMNFEVFPFAFVYEVAGGKAIDDKGRRILSLTPKHVHDTTPCFFGSKTEIKRVKEYYGTKK